MCVSIIIEKQKAILHLAGQHSPFSQLYPCGQKGSLAAHFPEGLPVSHTLIVSFACAIECNYMNSCFVQNA